jgi:alpha-tubulin suppressor-like RCC1 family protein
VFTWGDGAYGKLGHGDSLLCTVPVPVKELSAISIKAVACGHEHTLILTSDSPSPLYQTSSN